MVDRVRKILSGKPHQLIKGFNMFLPREHHIKPLKYALFSHFRFHLLLINAIVHAAHVCMHTQCSQRHAQVHARLIFQQRNTIACVCARALFVYVSRFNVALDLVKKIRDRYETSDPGLSFSHACARSLSSHGCEFCFCICKHTHTHIHIQIFIFAPCVPFVLSEDIFESCIYIHLFIYIYIYIYTYIR